MDFGILGDCKCAHKCGLWWNIPTWSHSGHLRLYVWKGMEL